MFVIFKDPWTHGRYIVFKDEKEVASYILCRGYFSSTIGTFHSGPSGSVYKRPKEVVDDSTQEE